MKSTLDLGRCLASLAIDALAVRQKACKRCLPNITILTLP